MQKYIAKSLIKSKKQNEKLGVSLTSPSLLGRPFSQQWTIETSIKGLRRGFEKYGGGGGKEELSHPTGSEICKFCLFTFFVVRPNGLVNLNSKLTSTSVYSLPFWSVPFHTNISFSLHFIPQFLDHSLKFIFIIIVKINKPEVYTITYENFLFLQLL